MIHGARVWVALMICALVGGGCGGSPSAPSPGPASGYAGEWQGTTTQGRRISLTVSPAQRVTAVTVEYTVGSCSGSRTLSNLDLPIEGIGNSSLPGPGFGYGSPTLDGRDQVQVIGWFTSSAAAAGTVAFIEFPGCGSGGGNWSATRR